MDGVGRTWGGVVFHESAGMDEFEGMFWEMGVLCEGATYGTEGGVWCGQIKGDSRMWDV